MFILLRYMVVVICFITSSQSSFSAEYDLGSREAAELLKDKWAVNVPRKPDQKIPDKPFTSWSLFLVGDPAWLVRGQELALRDLQARYKAFGKTTGPKHAAVWFEKVIAKAVREDGKVLEWEQVSGSIDTDRNVDYCNKFRLVPSDGPHIVVTTVHPDRWKLGDPKVTLAFAGQSADNIQIQISKLNDQIATKRLSQKELDSAAWWGAWKDLLQAPCNWLNKVKWGINVKVFKVERSGVCN